MEEQSEVCSSVDQFLMLNTAAWHICGITVTVVFVSPELGADFDLAPSQVRSYFPESWLWEVQRVR